MILKTLFARNRHSENFLRSLNQCKGLKAMKSWSFHWLSRFLFIMHWKIQKRNKIFLGTSENLHAFGYCFLCYMLSYKLNQRLWHWLRRIQKFQVVAELRIILILHWNNKCLQKSLVICNNCTKSFLPLHHQGHQTTLFCSIKRGHFPLWLLVL